MNEDTMKPESLIPEDLPKQQGHRGQKAARVNMAFSPENTEFLRIVSKGYKVNMTALVNHIIDRYRTENPEVMSTAISYERIQTELQERTKEAVT